MPRDSFFDDILKRSRSAQCRSGKHKDCDSTVPRGYDETHDHECACKCHQKASRFNPDPLPPKRNKRRNV